MRPRNPCPGRGARSLPSEAREEARAAGGVARGRDEAGVRPPTSRASEADVLEVEALQVFPESRSEVLALQGKLDCGFEETELVAGVVAFPLEEVSVDGPLFQERLEARGQLDLAPDVR